MARRELMLTHYLAEMVLLPVNDKVHEVVRITIFGPNFPQRAVEPEILVGDDLAQKVSIARDQKSIRGFFPKMPPEGAVVRVRYGDSQEGVVREAFSHRTVRPLSKECERHAAE